MMNDRKLCRLLENVLIAHSDVLPSIVEDFLLEEEIGEGSYYTYGVEVFFYVCSSLTIFSL